MDSLLIEGKINSPEINFNPLTGILRIIGRSIPEHPVKFYEPIEEWVSQYLNSNPPKIMFHIYLDYMNTHSTECLLILLKKLGEYKNANASAVVDVEWSFDEEDEDMEHLGKDLASITQLNFSYKEIIEE